jgi:hypothetical protein
MKDAKDAKDANETKEKTDIKETLRLSHRIKRAYIDSISRSISFIIALSWNDYFKASITKIPYGGLVYPMIITLIGTIIITIITFNTI